MLSSKFLNEQLNLIGKVGCAMCLVGSTVVVLHSPKEQEVERIEDLLEKIKDPGIYVHVLILTTEISTSEGVLRCSRKDDITRQTSADSRMMSGTVPKLAD